MSYQTPIIIEPDNKPEISIIWLHGLGADGNDFASIVPDLDLKTPVRFIFPHANSIPVSINGGMTMPAWYDITSTDFKQRTVDHNFKESVDYIHKIIDQQDTDKIIVAGFSQGGAIALHAGLTSSKSISGLILLSTYILDKDVLNNSLNKHLSVFVGHGSNDNIVPPFLGDEITAMLKSKNYNCEMHKYPMEHSVCHAEIIDISNYINSISSGI